MEKLRVLDLFSGIGGFSLGLERTGGFETVAFCEIDPFCRKVLAKHWPAVPAARSLPPPKHRSPRSTTMEYPDDVARLHAGIIREARHLATQVGGKELAQIQDATESTVVAATIVRIKARVQELDALAGSH
tara:strand:+ start:157 stop:549 length:393 start_codon:yes stop_codon:yes gene_type:complete